MSLAGKGVDRCRRRWRRIKGTESSRGNRRDVGKVEKERRGKGNSGRVEKERNVFCLGRTRGYFNLKKEMEGRERVGGRGACRRGVGFGR